MTLPIWKSVMYGLFIGTTVSSIILFIFRIIPISTLGMIIILYLYAIVGGITGYVVHKKVEENPSRKGLIIDQKVDKPKEELTKTINYRQVMDKIDSIKTTSLMIKDLIETRKKIEELRKESNSILEDTVKKVETKSLAISKNYVDSI